MSKETIDTIQQGWEDRLSLLKHRLLARSIIAAWEYSYGENEIIESEKAMKKLEEYNKQYLKKLKGT